MHINFEFGSHSSPSSLALRIAVAGGFSFITETTQTLSIDKDSFEEIISRLAGELLFEVQNHLASQPNEVLIKLPI